MSVTASPSGGRGFLSARGKDILIIVGLVVVTAGAVAMFIWNLSSDSSGENPRAGQKYHFVCTRCGKQFDMGVIEFASWAAKARPNLKDRGRANCPQCGGQFTGMPATVCPHCGRYVTVDQATKVRAAGGMVEWQCPKCRTVLTTIRADGED